MRDVFEKLESAFNNSAEFRPYIQKISFPKIKMLQPGMEMTFDYPITAIVGPNGANKTTILRAMEACPEGKSLSDYWFDTNLDVIDESNGTPRYFYEYSPYELDKTLQVMKARVNRAGRKSDYFETSRPRPKDGMRKMPPMHADDMPYRTTDRWKPIKKNVVYIDFRAQLPAYDIFMNFDWRNGKASLDDKKGLVRKTSGHLKDVLDDLASEKSYYGREKLISPAEELPEGEVETIGRILGKSYSRIRLVCHEFYMCYGWTAVLDSDDLEYSEAFAGSGEYAVIRLVHSVDNACEKSLILLDEPETSLHPGAQKELMKYLANESLKKKHQIVMSTHSPSMIEALPNQARKLLAVNKSLSYVYLASGASSLEESFVRIGASFGRNKILVEDMLAKEIVLAAARGAGDAYLQTIDLVSMPGGVSGLLRACIACAMMGEECIVLLDGDQRPEKPLSEGVRDSDLEEELESVGITDSLLIRDGGSGDSEAQLMASRRKVHDWFKSHVGYLPSEECPENLLIEMSGESPKPSPREAKEYWVAYAKTQLGKSESEEVDSQEILYSLKFILASFERDHPCFVEIREEIGRLHKA